MSSSLSKKGPWFDTCQRPPWQPPNYVFQFVWPVLYTIYGYILYSQWRNTVIRDALLIGLVLNISWVPVFIKNTQFALVILTAMVGVAAWTFNLLLHKTKVQWVLFSPYMAWLLFAWTLNAYIAVKCQ